MNPALIIIVVICCVGLWFLASGLYKPIGKFIHKIGKDAIDNLIDEEVNKNNDDEREKNI